jgi:nucleoside-diphosphate-sugar epimerase
MKTSIIGYGDIGQRIANFLVESNSPAEDILVIGRNEPIPECELAFHKLDLDDQLSLPSSLSNSQLFYLVPPQPHGETDKRSENLLRKMTLNERHPRRVVLISTTGIYGDCKGAWLNEETPVNPSTDRARRRHSAEMQWQQYCELNRIPLVILRVPGIYSFSRIPRERLMKATPVVRAEECGFTNRIHADDLALIAIAAMRDSSAEGIFNACDGAPSKISEYLIEAAKVIDVPAPREVSMAEARELLSENMLSYLNESRKISNEKVVTELKVTLRYPDFRIGLRH